MRPALPSLVVLACAACAAPSEGEQTACVTMNLDCRPLVAPPTFDAIYTNILQPTCAAGGGPCHNSGAGNLDMRSADVAYAALASRIDPSTIGCSTLARRLETTDEAFRMPPGSKLSEPQLCAIRQWMAQGAMR